MMKPKKLLQMLSVVAVAALGSTVALDSRPGEAASKKTTRKTKRKPAAKPSGAPTKAIIEQYMRDVWVKKAQPGMDGATSVVFHSVVIGKPREWSILDGGGGRKGTKVWPAKVHWTYRTHYRTVTDVRERRWVMDCFKNGFDEWVVQSNGDVKTEKKSEEPSTMK